MRALAVDTPVAGDGRVPSDPNEIVLLWPGTPPGGEGLSLPPYRVSVRTPPVLPLADRSLDQVGRPQLDVFRPARPDGSALVIAPGGGYSREVFDLEGMDIARHYNAQGVTCFMQQGHPTVVALDRVLQADAGAAEPDVAALAHHVGQIRPSGGHHARGAIADRRIGRLVAAQFLELDAGGASAAGQDRPHRVLLSEIER